MADGAETQSAPPKVQLTMEEVSKHNTKDDCWVVLNGKVFDVTHYLSLHPGGFDHLLEYGGTSVSEAFQETHPWVNAELLLAEHCVGEIVGPVDP